jgi:hypothetical protein
MYRMLKRREAIQPGDEVLKSDAETWYVLNDISRNRIAGWTSYDPNFHMPMRRKVPDASE